MKSHKSYKALGPYLKKKSITTCILKAHSIFKLLSSLFYYYYYFYYYYNYIPSSFKLDEGKSDRYLGLLIWSTKRLLLYLWFERIIIQKKINKIIYTTQNINLAPSWFNTFIAKKKYKYPYLIFEWRKIK